MRKRKLEEITERNTKGKRDKVEGGEEKEGRTMEELELMWKLAGMPYKALRVAGTMYPSKLSAVKMGAVWLFLI